MLHILYICIANGVVEVFCTGFDFLQFIWKNSIQDRSNSQIICYKTGASLTNAVIMLLCYKTTSNLILAKTMEKSDVEKQNECVQKTHDTTGKIIKKRKTIYYYKISTSFSICVKIFISEKTDWEGNLAVCLFFTQWIWKICSSNRFATRLGAFLLKHTVRYVVILRTLTGFQFFVIF